MIGVMSSEPLITNNTFQITSRYYLYIIRIRVANTSPLDLMSARFHLQVYYHWVRKGRRCGCSFKDSLAASHATAC